MFPPIKMKNQQLKDQRKSFNDQAKLKKKQNSFNISTKNNSIPSYDVLNDQYAQSYRIFFLGQQVKKQKQKNRFSVQRKRNSKSACEERRSPRSLLLLQKSHTQSPSQMLNRTPNQNKQGQRLPITSLLPSVPIYAPKYGMESLNENEKSRGGGSGNAPHYSNNESPNPKKKIFKLEDQIEVLTNELNRLYDYNNFSHFHRQYFQLFIQDVQVPKLQEILEQEIILITQHKSPFQICIKTIQARENCLDRLQDAIFSLGNAIESNLQQDEIAFLEQACRLLSHLRILTVNCAEAIDQWRDSLFRLQKYAMKKEKFRQNSTFLMFYYEHLNYILKIRSDTHFFNQSALMRYVPFSSQYDPFIVYPSKILSDLEQLRKMGTKEQELITLACEIQEPLKKRIQMGQRMIINECMGQRVNASVHPLTKLILDGTPEELQNPRSTLETRAGGDRQRIFSAKGSAPQNSRRQASVTETVELDRGVNMLNPDTLLLANLRQPSTMQSNHRPEFDSNDRNNNTNLSKVVLQSQPNMNEISTNRRNYNSISFSNDQQYMLQPAQFQAIERNNKKDLNMSYDLSSRKVSSRYGDSSRPIRSNLYDQYQRQKINIQGQINDTQNHQIQYTTNQRYTPQKIGVSGLGKEIYSTEPEIGQTPLFRMNTSIQSSKNASRANLPNSRSRRLNPTIETQSKEILIIQDNINLQNENAITPAPKRGIDNMEETQTNIDSAAEKSRRGAPLDQSFVSHNSKEVYTSNSRRGLEPSQSKRYADLPPEYAISRENIQKSISNNDFNSYLVLEQSQAKMSRQSVLKRNPNTEQFLTKEISQKQMKSESASHSNPSIIYESNSKNNLARSSQRTQGKTSVSNTPVVLKRNTNISNGSINSSESNNVANTNEKLNQSVIDYLESNYQNNNQKDSLTPQPQSSLHTQMDFVVKPTMIQERNLKSYLQEYFCRIPNMLYNLFISNSIDYIETLKNEINFNLLEIYHGNKLGGLVILHHDRQSVEQRRLVISHMSSIIVENFSPILQQLTQYIWQNDAAVQLRLCVYFDMQNQLELNNFQRFQDIFYQHGFRWKEMKNEQKERKITKTFGIMRPTLPSLKNLIFKPVSIFTVMVQMALMVSQQYLDVEEHILGLNQVVPPTINPNKLSDFTVVMASLIKENFNQDAMKEIKNLPTSTGKIRALMDVALSINKHQIEMKSNIEKLEFQTVELMNKVLISKNDNIFLLKDSTMKINKVNVNLLEVGCTLPNFLNTVMVRGGKKQSFFRFRTRSGQLKDFCWLLRSQHASHDFIIMPTNDESHFLFFAPAAEYMENNLAKDLFVYIHNYLENVTEQVNLQRDLWIPHFQKRVLLNRNPDFYPIYPEQQIYSNYDFTFGYREYLEGKMMPQDAHPEFDYVLKPPFIMGILSSQLDQHISNIPQFSFLVSDDDITIFNEKEVLVNKGGSSSVTNHGKKRNL